MAAWLREVVKREVSAIAILRVRHPGCAGLRPACLQVSPLHLISKWPCAWDMRTGGPRTQSAHPARVPLLRIPVIRGSVPGQLLYALRILRR